MIPNNAGAAPLFVYDGECAFCRAWIERWKEWTHGRIACAPFQQAAARFPQIPLERFKQAVQLILPEGAALSGADAIFWTLAFSRNFGGLLWAYDRLPGFAWCAEAVYRLVSRHRNRLWRPHVKP